MKHLDLFSGIGGFALSADWTWPGIEHVFVEIDPFCQQVLRKHWPKARIYDDVKKVTGATIIGTIGGNVADGKGDRLQKRGVAQERQKGQFAGEDIYLLTGGFPCQPFSQAGKRKGRDDERHLWPEMLRIIREVHPTWIIAENVRGLLTIEGGMAFEQVCIDLEAEGYDVQTFVIPACAVNAPHRRDRVWIVGNARNGKDTPHGDTGRFRRHKREGVEKGSTTCGCGVDASDTEKQGLQGRDTAGAGCTGGRNTEHPISDFGADKTEPWGEPWIEVATRTCLLRVDARLPTKLDGLKLSGPKHRVERLKSLGNSIVPQVAYEIMKAIRETEA